MTGILIEKENDIQLLKTIARTGLITKDIIYQLGIDNRRLKQHIQKGNIIDTGNYILYGTMTQFYGLSKKAKYRMRSEFLIDLYKSDINQLEHDYVLSKFYCSLPIELRETWKTETTLKEMYGKDVTTTDGLIIYENQKIGIEVITVFYSKKEIDRKIKFIMRYCDNHVILHTHKKKY